LELEMLPDRIDTINNPPFQKISKYTNSNITDVHISKLIEILLHEITTRSILTIIHIT